jgi:hypothetical protein
MSSEKKKLECVCGKTYASPPSLCVHRKKCNIYLEHKKNKTNSLPDRPDTPNKLISLMMDLLQNNQKRTSSPPKLKAESNTQFCLDTFLNETCKNAYNFDDIFDDFIFNADYNSWLLNIDNGKEEFNLLKNLNINSYSRGSNFYVDFFCEPFNKIEHTKKPIYCSDAKRNIYYFKNNNEWSKIHYTELINKIYRKISSKPLILLNYIFSPTLKKISEKQFYKIYPTITDFTNVKQSHYDKLILNFCDTSPEQFLHKCNMTLKKLTSKTQEDYTKNKLDANDNELFKDEDEE